MPSFCENPRTSFFRKARLIRHLWRRVNLQYNGGWCYCALQAMYKQRKENGVNGWTAGKNWSSAGLVFLLCLNWISGLRRPSKNCSRLITYLRTHELETFLDHSVGEPSITNTLWFSMKLSISILLMYTSEDIEVTPPFETAMSFITSQVFYQYHIVVLNFRKFHCEL